MRDFFLLTSEYWKCHKLLCDSFGLIFPFSPYVGDCFLVLFMSQWRFRHVFLLLLCSIADSRLIFLGVNSAYFYFYIHNCE